MKKTSRKRSLIVIGMFLTFDSGRQWLERHIDDEEPEPAYPDTADSTATTTQE